MTVHPYRNVAIAGVFNTPQRRRLEGETSLSIALKAAIGVMEQVGIGPPDLDGIASHMATDVCYALGAGPVVTLPGGGVGAVHLAADAIAAGSATTVLIANGGASVYTDRAATAPWTRPTNEFVGPVGMFTAAEFALLARRHMHLHGTTEHHLALVAATIRNHGHINPEAVYHGRGPFTAEDVLASRMIADPFRLLDCSTNTEGGTAMVVTTADRARALVDRPVYILGAGDERLGPAYEHPPMWDLRGAGHDEPLGYIGRRAAYTAFDQAGLGPDDVDVCEFYDPFSFEIIRQFEAFGFCKEGEGPELVADGHIGLKGRWPTTTDGGLMSFSHPAGGVQALQRLARGVSQLQGRCVSGQVTGAEVALCSNFGAGALMSDVMLIGSAPP